ncbi:MAG TPA: helix-turn-helix transcriptional regulator [Baekduia sp.]|nr:helix-turn-helix transcriptional regulator [Baekduia sp.]
MPFFYILPSVRAARDAPLPAAAWLADPLLIFGANFRHERTTRGLTQEQVADIAEIDASYYSRLAVYGHLLADEEAQALDLEQELAPRDTHERPADDQPTSSLPTRERPMSTTTKPNAADKLREALALHPAGTTAELVAISGLSRATITKQLTIRHQSLSRPGQAAARPPAAGGRAARRSSPRRPPRPRA